MLRGKHELVAGSLVVDFHQKRHEPTRVERMGPHTTVITRGAVLYLMNAQASPVQVVLPDNTATALPIIIKKTDTSSNTVTIKTATGKIDGQLTFTLTAPLSACTLVSDGKDWYTV